MIAEWKYWGGRLAVSLGLLVVATWYFAPELGFFVARDPQVALEVRRDIRTFTDLSTWPSGDGTFQNQGFVPCLSGSWTESGWCLPPGGQGTLRYLLPAVPQSRGLLVRMFFFRKDPQVNNRLLVFREGETTPRLRFDNPYFADERLDLSSALSGPGGRIILSFEGENPTSHPDVVVQYFEVRGFSESLPEPPALTKMALAFLALGVCLLPLVSWRLLVPLWTILTIGFALRYHALIQTFLLPLDWDAVGFHQLSRKMALFTETGFFSARFGHREPLFPLILKGGLALLGDCETHVRLVSFFASLLTILMTYRVGRKLFNRPLSLLGALTIAVCLPLIRESARGMRLEVEMVLLLAFIELAFVRRLRSRWLQAGLAGTLAGLLSLLRTTYLLDLVPLLFVAFGGRNRQALCLVGLAVLLMVGLQFPHRWNGHRLYGDWSWDNDARWWANAEFAGQPGWPRKLEMWQNTGQGRKVNSVEYFFGLHTIPELVIGHVRGFWKLVRHMDVVAFHRGVERITGINLAWADAGFQLLGMLGLVLAAYRRGLRWLPLAFLVLIAHLPFLYDRGLVEVWRHTYHVFPLVLFGALLALARLMHHPVFEKTHT